MRVYLNEDFKKLQNYRKLHKEGQVKIKVMFAEWGHKVDEHDEAKLRTLRSTRSATTITTTIRTRFRKEKSKQVFAMNRFAHSLKRKSAA